MLGDLVGVSPGLGDFANDFATQHLLYSVVPFPDVSQLDCSTFPHVLVLSLRFSHEMTARARGVRSCASIQKQDHSRHEEQFVLIGGREKRHLRHIWHIWDDSTCTPLGLYLGQKFPGSDLDLAAKVNRVKYFPQLLSLL